MAEPVGKTEKYLAPREGGVTMTVESGVTEREIADDRSLIVMRLHSCYLNLADQMSEFQQQWDDNPVLAFINSAHDGWNAGGAEWLSDQAELFEKETWINFGNQVKEFAGAGYDRLATYSAQRYEEIRDELNRHIENPDDTIYNWAWWQKSIEDAATSMVTRKAMELQAAREAVVNAGRSVLAGASQAQAIYKHRNAILNLPNLIAAGDPKPIQAFVDKELMEIDPELAKAIRNSQQFPIVLEIIADHESALSYLSYASLMVEAIPPNFYAYVAGKGGAYLMIEVVLLIVTALLSAGAAVAGRIAMLVARFATAGAKAANLGKKLKRAKQAIDSFIRMLEDLSRAVDELHMLGYKLLQARAKGLVVRGRTRSTLTARKAAVKRDKRCRCCGSTTHSTPRTRIGVIVYE